MKWLGDNGLTIVLAAATLITLIGMTMTGCRPTTANRRSTTSPSGRLPPTRRAGHSLSAAFGNRENEFLSTAVLIVLSNFLRFRGSPESKPVAAPQAKKGE